MIIPMSHQKLSLNEKNILDALNKEHLTSVQILNRIRIYLTYSSGVFFIR